MTKRYYFFDLDGTLADTDHDIRAAWKVALAKLGLESPDFDAKFVAGPPLEEMLKALFPREYTEALGDAARREFGLAYDTCGFPNTPEYPGVMGAARRLRDAGARVFIVTNKRWRGATALAAKYGWMDVFEGLYTGDMFCEVAGGGGGRMRKPELLRYVIETLKAPPEECVMVGDTVSDFEAAKRNGIASVAVGWGYGKPEELAMADRLVTRPEELTVV